MKATRQTARLKRAAMRMKTMSLDACLTTRMSGKSRHGDLMIAVGSYLARDLQNRP